MAALADTQPPVYVTVSALDAGHLTLPEHLFVTDADPEKRTTVPSLSFLIQHPSPSPSRTGKHADVTNLVFDLGVKRDIGGYASAQQAHIAQRQPVITDPDCAASLRKGIIEPDGQGGLDGQAEEAPPLLDPAADIDFVLLSHVHWDHVGTPSDFSNSTFLVGSGTLDLLAHGAGPLYPAELFNRDELPASRTVEFPPAPPTTAAPLPHAPSPTPTPSDTRARLPPAAAAGWAWQPLGALPATLDVFGDGSVRVVDSPGHLPGHVNLLCRLGHGRYVYLGGDCCHDRRILLGERGIAMYADGKGGTRSVHVDTQAARKTLHEIGSFVEEAAAAAQEEGGGWDVEVVVAHDGEWRERNRDRFWPGKL